VIIAPPTAVTVRPLRPSDRARVAEMTRAAGVFREAEVAVALDVFDGATGAGGRRVDPDYESAGVEIDGDLGGWACWGPTPGTEGTFDLYWIVVDPGRQGRGLGSRLLEEMDRRIAGRARLVLIETSSRDDYGATRAFYQRHGYRLVATIPAFYAPGDDRVTFARRYQPR
jgi:ribosomal protein S18 acetylase RimI-like enzyme